MTTSPVIHVVDDDASFRTSIARLLGASGYQVALYGSASELLGELGYRLPIVFLTGYGDVATTVRAIKAGAEDFLTKPVPKKDLLAAIERALNRHQETRDRDGRIAALRLLVSRLTPRESEVFAMVVRGMLNKQIAHELGVAERTVKAHRQQVMEKCEVQSFAELVLLAERLGMAPSPTSRNGDKS
jgi:FixJ family two-component response regulator